MPCKRHPCLACFVGCHHPREACTNHIGCLRHHRSIHPWTASHLVSGLIAAKPWLFIFQSTLAAPPKLCDRVSLLARYDKPTGCSLPISGSQIARPETHWFRNWWSDDKNLSRNSKLSIRSIELWQVATAKFPILSAKIHLHSDSFEVILPFKARRSFL